MKPENKTDSGKRWVALLPAVILLVLVGYGPWQFFRQNWLFGRLEENAKKKITAGELQRWGTNLLAHAPPGDYSVEKLGTNFPPALVNLWTAPPRIYIHESTTNESGEISPGWIRITWGGGGIGHQGFAVGPTNLTQGRGTRWQQPGVSFWSDWPDRDNTESAD